MMSTQSRHTVPLNHADAPLFGTGAEKSVINNLPDGFVVKAKQDGKVKKYDKANNILILEYKDRTKDVIDLDSVITHNSAGGFYENLKYDVLFAEGRKFSKNEVIAKVSDYFKGEKNGDLIYSMGHLTKTALTGLDQNYEDSTVITSNLSKSLATNVTMNKTVVLGTSANVSFIAKKGQSIKTGDPLLVFENSFNDDSISNVLNKAGDEFKQTIQEFGNKIVKSHYTGKVVDVKIYRNREIEEFSDSLQKLIKSYENKYAKKEKAIAKEVDPQDQNLYSNNTPPLGVIDSDKIKGRDVEGIMIEFYIQYEDFMAVGDKLTAYCIGVSYSNI